MAISRNASAFETGSRSAFNASSLFSTKKGILEGIVEKPGGAGKTGNIGIPQSPSKETPAKTFEPEGKTLMGKEELVFNKDLIAKIPELTKFFPAFEITRTTTQLAQNAIQQLSAAAPEVLRDAITAIRNKNIAAPNVMNYLERRVIIGEVLNKLARDWSAETKQDFAEAFQIKPEMLDAMDSIVSIAILNDRDLEEELKIENTPAPTEGDLLENRRIVWQYPAPGTVLQPPYVVLVAIEHEDTAKAQEIIQSITGSLVDFQGFKVPKAALQKL